MAQTVAERMARYRARQRDAGLVTISVVVPAADTGLVSTFATERRKLHQQQRRRDMPSTGVRWFSALPVPADALVAGKDQAEKLTPARRAQALADTMLDQIVRRRWPIGWPLGSQAELMREHGASRAVMRQAIRLLEHQGVARTRRGAGGGLMVNRPDVQTMARAVSVCLEYEGISARDIMHTRRTLELSALGLAIERLDAAGEQRLRALLIYETHWDGRTGQDDLQRLHITLAELSGDPALRLFISIVLRLTDTHSSFSKRPRADRVLAVSHIKRLHRDISHAVIRRDHGVAASKLSRYIDGLRDWMK